jgi:hypothetical protein
MRIDAKVKRAAQNQENDEMHHTLQQNFAFSKKYSLAVREHKATRSGLNFRQQMQAETQASRLV